MNMYIALGGAAALLTLGACAAPNNERVDLEASRLASLETGQEMVCARERTTGTRLGEIVCRTQAEIDAERERSQDYARQRNSSMRDGERGPRTFGPD